MTDRRPSRTLYIVLAALLVLLPLLAFLQFRWIGEFHQAARRDLGEHLKQDGAQFVDDFNRELTRILTAFQIRGVPDRPDLSDWYAMRFDDSTATYPNLVQRVFLARRPETDLELLAFDPANREMKTVDWPEEYSSVREIIESRMDRSGRSRTNTVREPLSNGNPVFIIPAVPDFGRARGGFGRGRNPGQPPTPVSVFSIIELNAKTLYGDFIPSLVARNFSLGSNSDYRVAIVSTGPNRRVVYSSDPAEAEIENPDLRLPLFSTEPGNRPRPPANNNGDFSPRGNARPPFPGFGAGMRGVWLTGNWELLVQHRAGSLDAAIASTRNRDIGVAFGILLMLALSVILVLVSSHRARALAQLQMDFVARVSHELRTPLAIIRSAAYNLATGVVSDEQGVREYAGMVQTEGQRLSNMVDQILTFSRTESRRDTYDVHPVYVDEIVDRVMSNVSAALNAAGCTIDRQVDDKLPRVKADERAFTECLQNLVTNALKYGCTQSANRIRVEAMTNGDGAVLVSVADSGPGIDTEDLAHIFEPFFRGKNATSDTPGSGLGLNLVRRMMLAQGGDVSVESEPGQGARFTLHLTAVSEVAS
jgi:signal transduction histidine kinase